MVKVTKEAALEYHHNGRPGKIEVKPTKPYSTQTDLSLAYSPGVAYPCLEIQQNPDDVYKYTAKGNLVAVISNGTAVLGLGNIGAMSGKPVMEGKGLLFKIYGGVDVFDIEINEQDPDKFCEAVEKIAPTFGGINLEDIKAPECFAIEERLKRTLDIPVMHDDQHGTAIISAAGLKNALEVAGKDISKIKLVVNGAGAAAISCTKMYVALGVKKENIVMLDSKGVITSDRENLTPQKALFATDRRDVHTLEEAINGADVFVGLSKGNILSQDMIRSMNEKPIVFALANPVPEISYDDAIAARPDVIMSTGRSDYPNQINNVIGFPKYFIPKPVDPRLITEVSAAVAKAAMDSGVARTPIKDFEAYKQHLRQMLGQETKLTRSLHATAAQHPQRIVFAEGGHPTMMKAAVQAKQEGICVPILLGNQDRLNRVANRLKLDISDIEIIDMRADKEQGHRATYAKHLAEKRAREGYTFEEAYDKMYERNYYGMSMVENGDADAFITGLYTKYSNTIKVAKEVIGIRPEYKHFGTMHILNTKKGVFYIADTLINRHPDSDVLTDVARLAAHSVKFFNDEPAIAMLSFSNFGSDNGGSPEQVREAVAKLQAECPDLAIDGEMQVNFALNKELRDEKFPFTRLKGKDVNTLVFPDLSSANSGYKLLQALSPEAEVIGPIQMGLNKPIHFTDFESSVRDIVNITAVAAIDAYVEKLKKNK